MSGIVSYAAGAALGAVEAAGQLAEIHRLRNSPLPTSADGLTDAQAAPLPDKKSDQHHVVFTIAKTINEQIKKGLPITADVATADAIVDAVLHAKNEGMDDSKLLLETVFTLMARLPTGSSFQRKLTNKVVGMLYDELPHPPGTYMGRQYAYRQPDGGYNNPFNPDLGRAGTPYARSVAATHPIPPSALPDPGLVFDTLLRREQYGGVPHPSGISSLLFAMASLITHSLFRTAHPHKAAPPPNANGQPNGNGHPNGAPAAANGPNAQPPATSSYPQSVNPDLYAINETSSYLDLSPLYGHDEESQKSVRLVDGRGRIHDDVFADSRLLLMPASACALLIVFARNHNYIATKLLQINERGTYRDPTKLPEAAIRAQDDDIFNKARLVNCGFFMNVILGDYIGAILGLFREGSDFCLNPLEEIRVGTHSEVPRGQGNAVSVEFNLLYRWHATLSSTEEKETEAVFRNFFPDKAFDEITPMDFAKAAHMYMIPKNADPRAWEFGGLKRGADGRFSDADLARVLQDATQTVSSRFGARGTPEVLRVIEIIGINQSRQWGVCSLNEFRKFIGLKPYESFAEWNPDKEIAGAAERLYEHIDNLELYIGMQAEKSKPCMMGSGLCGGYTMTRAILADAVCLTRGDRFFTTDFTPFHLTAWGYQDCARTVDNGCNGGMLSKLLFRTLPHHYSKRSVHAYYPFVIPTEMQKYLTAQGIADKYEFMRPQPAPHVHAVNTFKGVDQVLGDMRTFKTTYDANMKALTKGHGFFLGFNEPGRHRRDRDLMHRVFSNEVIQHSAEFYFNKTTELIKEKSFSIVGSPSRSVNIVRDVFNLVPVHWVSTEIAGLPLKTKNTPKGLHTEQDLYKMFVVVFSFIFLDLEPVNHWPLRENATKVAELIIGYIKAHLQALSPSSSLEQLSLPSISGLRDYLTHMMTGQDDHSHDFLKTLLDTGREIDELAYMLFGVIVGSVANFAQAATHVLDFYLDDERKKERERIIELCTKEANDKELLGYVREALRFQPQAPGIFRMVNHDTEIIEGGNQPSIQAHKGDWVFVSLAKANLDSDMLPDPLSINPHREREQYSFFGRGAHSCLGDVFTEKTLPEVLRAVFRLKNVRRGPGLSGKLNRFEESIHGTKKYTYINSKGLCTPWPSSLVIQYDT